MTTVDHAGGHPTQPEIIHPAVVRLAEGTAVVRRVLAGRPELVAEALLGGRRRSRWPRRPGWT